MNNKQQLLEHWTKHPDLFIEDMLGIKLPYYQRVILRLMNFNKRLRSSDVPNKYRLCKYGSEFCNMCEVKDCEVRDKL